MNNTSFIILLISSCFLIAAGQDVSLNSQDTKPDSLEELSFSKPAGTAKPPPKKYVPVTDSRGIQESIRNLKPITLADLTDDLGDWEAPLYLQKNFNYYLSGYDEENRPLWIAEVGKMDLRQVLDGSKVAIDTMDKFVAQVAYRIFQSLQNVSTPDNTVTEINYIVDADGLNLAQVGHIPTVAYVVRLLTLYRELIIEHLGATYAINANALMNIVVNLARPIFREAMEKVEIYGSNKERWLPVLRSKFSRDSLPPWYGGNPNYKPLAVYG